MCIQFAVYFPEVCLKIIRDILAFDITDGSIQPNYKNTNPFKQNLKIEKTAYILKAVPLQSAFISYKSCFISPAFHQHLLVHTVSGYSIYHIFPPIIISLVISRRYSENDYSYCFLRTIADQKRIIYTDICEQLYLIRLTL